VAPGRAATVAGYTALLIGAMEPVANLAGAQTGNRPEERPTHRAKPKLPTVGGPGCLPPGPDAAHLFFRPVCRRCGRGAMPVTSNRAVGERGDVFGDAVAATAIPDRPLRHGHLVTIRGDRRRLREKRRGGLLQKPAATPETATAST